jgi:hypothetical protein
VILADADVDFHEWEDERLRADLQAASAGTVLIETRAHRTLSWSATSTE